MGFTTGFLGGFTLTSSVIYLTISLHHKNRATQAALLRQQRLVLLQFVEPLPATAAEPLPRTVDGGLLEMAKDRWNRELETVVKGVYGTDWRRVRERAEDRIAGVVERVGGK